MNKISFDDLVEQLPTECCHPFDLADHGDDMARRRYFDKGYLCYRGLQQHLLIDEYIQERSDRNIPSDGYYQGPTPYLESTAVMNLCCNRPVDDFLTAVFGEKFGVNLVLTNWLTTERDWHQDAYLSPREVGSHTCALWMALETISPNSGPFEFAVGSHKLDFMTVDNVFKHIPESIRSDPKWPKLTESLVSEACAAKIAEMGYEVRQFIPAYKGDVLLWHPRLLHRGSRAAVPGTRRRSLIAHYSSVNKRSKIDMKTFREAPLGGYYYDPR